MPTPRHIVAVAGLVVDPKEDRVLLVRSPRRGWEFPGGQVEEGESLTEALVREIQEEAGVLVSVGALVGVYSNVHSHIVMLDFLCTWSGGEPATSPESLEVEWVPRNEALSYVTCAPLQDRLRDMLEFQGQVIYRSYEYAISGEGSEDKAYHIREEHLV